MNQKEIEPTKQNQTEESIKPRIFIKESNSNERKLSKIVIKKINKTE